MTTAPLSPAAARRVFYALSFTRWFPVGLIVGMMTLLPLDRGLSVAQALAAFAFTGWVVFALELPTSGFADAFGRKPVYVAAAVVQVAAGLVYLFAQSFWVFVLGSVLTGVFRALDSGPLEAWFVDAVHATDPGADVDQPLARQGTILGLGMAAGSLVSAGLIAWHPFAQSSALNLPFAVFVALTVVHLVATVVLVKEPRTHVDSTGLRRAVASAKEAPGVVRDGLGMLRSNRILRGLVLVEVFWSIAMIVFETFQPIRLAELLGSEERAGAWMGVVAAGGWAIFAAGSGLAGLVSKRLGVTRTAILGRVLNSLGAVWMGLVLGPVALVVAYLFTYSMHGFAGPMHGALLHREASARNRATVLSMNSMMMFAAYSGVAPLLGLLAERTSNQVAMVLAGALSLLGAFLYLPALRHERQLRTEPAGDAAPV
ncbi:putative MFS family arabinose efflux permease [Knoellia remsis]|uniref:Putative MFS family arabinose efflux permease n=1 Tax=Knoellia remsis TaxID=407159 RepID=A0A2T0UQV5_9MICO|nr:MFS transporter [Knoellia remsis]PRY60311.1 putative MFS family arabinose efflux permease [Knoellia remsis]